MRSSLRLLLVCGAVLHAGCGPSPTAPTGGGPQSGAGLRAPPGDAQEFERLKGTWQVTAIEAAGKPVPPERVRKLGLRYVFDGDKVTVRRPDRPDTTSTFVVDGGTNPKRMTIHQAPAVRAVYAVEGDTLRLCLMVEDNAGAGYPAELASKAMPKTDLLTLERR